MRLSAPTLVLGPAWVTLSASLEAAGHPGEPCRVDLQVPRHLAGSIDVTATPFLPIAAVAAAAQGEDLAVEGPVASATVHSASSVTARFAEWWAQDGWRAPAIDAPITVGPGPADPTRGHGLFFSGGMDSWASLIALRGAGVSEGSLTHLLTIDGTDRHHSPASQARVTALCHEVAAEVDLPIIDLRTNARDLLDDLAVWDRTHGAVLAAFALLLQPMLARVSIASSHAFPDPPHWGSHIEIDHRWSTPTLLVEHHLPDTSRNAKAALVAGSPAAVDRLLVCWRSDDGGNCCRCAKCLRTMTALHMAGALDRAGTFPRPLTTDAVRATDHDDGPGFVTELLRDLPPGALADAWRSHLPAPLGERTLGDAAPLALAGPGLEARLQHGLLPTGWRLHRPALPPTDRPAVPLAIGWEPGMVPLRPSRAVGRAAATARTDDESRPYPWVVAEMSDIRRVNDPGQAAVAAQAEATWGPGLTYLAGIAWDDDLRPVLDSAAVSRLLRAARARLWWRESGTLDAVHVVESIEHGCLPVQVMPPAEVDRLRAVLPPPLAGLVVAIDDLASLAPDRPGWSGRLDAAAALVLAGSVERDLAVDAVFGPVATHG